MPTLEPDDQGVKVPSRGALSDEIVAHEHCAEGACESCDCCAAGWCVAFEDGDPYPQQFYGYSEPYSQRLLDDARDTFDLWASMVLDAWEVEARPSCPAQTGPVWKIGGEPCGCTLPGGHSGDHECSCGSWWVDSIRRDLPTPPGLAGDA